MQTSNWAFRQALLTVSALTAAAACATGAAAQTAAGNTSAASSNEPALADIVVTAQRRSENIQKVPISLTAVSGADLQRLSITSPKNMQFATPGLTFPEDNGTINPYIRGRGTGYSGNGLEGSVAVYIDDVYAESQFGTGGLTDISQIQVLKGPQGTLYGRNATGGAVLIKTNDPTHQLEGHVEAGYGNLNMWRVEGVLNVPVSNTLALRFVAEHDNRDGFLHNVVDGSKAGYYKHSDLRVKALWEPDSRFSALASVDWQRTDNSYERVQLVDGTGKPGGLGFYETRQSPSVGNENAFHFPNIWTTSLRLNYKGDNFTATSITGYRTYFNNFCSDNENVYPNYDSFCAQTAASSHSYAISGTYGRTFSQELRLATSFDGPLNFTLGSVYMYYKARFPAIIEGSIFGGLQPVFDNYVNLRNYSVYGEVYYTLAQGLKLTAGARWSKDSRTLTVFNNADLAPGFGIPPQFAPPATFTQDASFSNVTPRVVLNYDAGNANFYASYNKGFKSGGFNVPALFPQVPLRPETINSFEVGAKFKMLDNRLRLDIAAFISKSKDVQVASIDTQSNSVVQQNAAGVKAHGGEASLSFAATTHLTLGLGASYLKSRFTSFPAASVFQLGANGLMAQGVEDLKDFPTTNSPTFTANGDATYQVDLPGDWSASVTVAGRYSSSYDFQAGAGGPLRIDRQKAFGVVNLTGEIVAPGKHLSLRWYVNNMFQTHYYDQIQTGANVGGFAIENGKAGGTYAVPALPRTFGGAVRYTF